MCLIIHRVAYTVLPLPFYFGYTCPCIMEKLHHINLTYFTHFVLSFSFLNYAWSLNGRNVTISISDRSGGALFLISILGTRRKKPDCLSIPGHVIQTSSPKRPANNTQANFFLFWQDQGPEGSSTHVSIECECVCACGHRCKISWQKKKTPQKHLRHSNWKRDTLRDQIEDSIYIYDTTTCFSGDADLFMWRWAC